MISTRSTLSSTYAEVRSSAIARASAKAGRSVKPVQLPPTSSFRNSSEESPRRPDTYQSTSLPSERSSAARRLPARMICELNGPASPRSPVTSRMPTVRTLSFSSRIGRLGMFSAACEAREVMRRMASAYGRRCSMRCSAPLLVPPAVLRAGPHRAHLPGDDAVGLALLDRVALGVEVRTEVVDRLGDGLAQVGLDRVVPLTGGDLLHQIG